MASFMMSSQPRAASSRLQPSNSRKSWNSPGQTRALLSIRPPYAEAIFRGEKRFEFRRAIFRKAVDVVVVYITSPTCLVAGEFDVTGIISDSVEDLWSLTSRYAGIDRDGFFSYFRGRDVGHAIAIGSVRKYTTPLGSRLGLRNTRPTVICVHLIIKDRQARGTGPTAGSERIAKTAKHIGPVGIDLLSRRRGSIFGKQAPASLERRTGTLLFDT